MLAIRLVEFKDGARHVSPVINSPTCLEAGLGADIHFNLLEQAGTLD